MILPNVNIEIVKECTGYFLTSGFLALTFALSKRIRDFIIGIFITILAYLVNILRILLISYFLNLGYRTIWHDILGYIIIIIFAPLLSYLYLRLIE
ncbi:archaeosortase family protein ArtE [Methanocaldococcus villosus]|uniref:archaeosortase family protein ArtE n=1 Tax=Methanocaldococcus villosus TaxID=667126 RepID=UPI00373AE7AE